MIATDAPAQSPDSPRPARANPSTAGKRAFAARCAGCHGLDGRGGERAPNIATSSRTLGLSDAQLETAISQGKPSSGMPAFRLLGTAEIQRLVAYLRILQGNRSMSRLAGDPNRGKAIFFGKGDCGSCHSISGQGALLGSDLSAYSRTRNADAIRNSITAPSPGKMRRSLAAATTLNGTTLKGLIRNEDNFSIQLQSEDGVFHLLLKSELQKLEYRPPAPMPKDYGEKLTPQELNDLVGYLQSVAVTERSPGEEE